MVLYCWAGQLFPSFSRWRQEAQLHLSALRVIRPNNFVLRRFLGAYLARSAFAAKYLFYIYFIRLIPKAEAGWYDSLLSLSNWKNGI